VFVSFVCHKIEPDLITGNMSLWTRSELLIVVFFNVVTYKYFRYILVGKYLAKTHLASIKEL